MNELKIKIDNFEERHIGNNQTFTNVMLAAIGVSNLNDLIENVVPQKIRLQHELDLSESVSEQTILSDLKIIASKNKLFKNYIGQGYYGTFTPSVILRNVFENPGWYTQYTPYQAEIAQGRLESLLNFQTMVVSLTGLPIANASLLDEATAAAEAMTMIYHASIENKNKIFFIDETIFPQTISVLKTRANALSIQLKIGDFKSIKLNENYVGAILQYPNKYGEINDFSTFIETAKSLQIKTILATDLLALTLLKSPGELGVDVAIGSTQRFGVPLGFGGPHAAFFATTDNFKRNIPGRIIGISIDAQGNRALRMALQTREQHIKREKATSNICTAQALLANMAAMFAVYHGPEKIVAIANRIHLLTSFIFKQLTTLGYINLNNYFFDTISFQIPANISMEDFKHVLESNQINVHYFNEKAFSISIDETANFNDVTLLTNLLLSIIQKEINIKDIEIEP
ncbi:MAG: glycine dehydrogenase (aminomethyl-transferring), partial [Sediminibacterium sp.]|nr:glycine dehydrogenase (aminomethyl-transferring) [Sediminibacterium sp.]